MISISVTICKDTEQTKMMNPEKIHRILAKDKKTEEVHTYEPISETTKGKKTVFMMAVFHPH